MPESFSCAPCSKGRCQELNDISRLCNKSLLDKNSICFFRDSLLFIMIYKFLCTRRVINRSLIKAIDSVGDPPLPIPNREVKPNSADGTAKICGRVGHRHFYREAGVQKTPAFFVYMACPPLPAVLSCRIPPGITFSDASCDRLLPALTSLPCVQPCGRVVA